jgi:hypothetical protein
VDGFLHRLLLDYPKAVFMKHAGSVDILSSECGQPKAIEVECYAEQQGWRDWGWTVLPGGTRGELTLSRREKALDQRTQCI